MGEWGLGIGYATRALTETDAVEIARWRYPAPYHIYDSAPPEPSGELLAATAAYYTEPAHAYFAVDDEGGRFLGFGCSGGEAQVPGYDYTQSDALDIGCGMRPDRVGNGRGQPFLAAILSHLTALYHPPRFRATVATFNERSARTFLRAGFLPVGSFVSQTAQPIPFGVYLREPLYTTT